MKKKTNQALITTRFDTLNKGQNMPMFPQCIIVIFLYIVTVCSFCSVDPWWEEVNCTKDFFCLTMLILFTLLYKKHTHRRISQRYRSESRRGEWALFSLMSSVLSFVFLWHASSYSAEVLADAWCHGPANRLSWSVSLHDCVSRWSWRVSVWSVWIDWREACLLGVST